MLIATTCHIGTWQGNRDQIIVDGITVYNYSRIGARS